MNMGGKDMNNDEMILTITILDPPLHSGYILLATLILD